MQSKKTANENILFPVI